MHHSRLLLSLALTCGALGCVSDFSPEPLKESEDLSEQAEAGTATGDTSESRTSSSSSTSTSSTSSTRDSGGNPSSNSAGTCDLSGRWIVTERAQSSAYGAQQVSQVWFYVELAQQGDSLTVMKSLLCGQMTKQPEGELFAVNVDDHAAWPGYQRYANYNGRKGTSKDSGAGCAVSFEPAVLIRGMTPDHYKDLSHKLPTLDQKEEGSTPGWADWDNDGKPGISQVVTGSASGTIYSSIRTTTTNLSGSIHKGAQSFKLDNFVWKQERVVLGTRDPDPLGILSSPAERTPTAGVNFVEFARLQTDQATGSDDDVCKAIRNLAPTLNPAANKK